MNAKKIKNANTTTMGNNTRYPLLNCNELAQGQSDRGSRTDNDGTENLLADTGKSKTATSKTRRSKKKITKLTDHRRRISRIVLI
jgi:hypothetical protein